MEEQEETAAPTFKQAVLCEECKLNPSKYKCPGCSIRSCSLPCVKAHKQRSGCTGKRQQTHFVPLSQFDDNLLLSDYNMLEDVKRVAESARRLRAKLGGNSHFRLPFPLKCLRSAAASRSTKLLFLSSGMSKRETNRSYYNYRKKFISWTIEWRFHSTDVVIVDHGIDENRNLCSVIENHLRPGPWNHRLRQFCKEPLDSLKFFIRKYSKGPKSPFRELDMKGPIRQQLANLYILEYPVILVFLPSQSLDFEITKDVFVRKPAVKEFTGNDPLSPNGVIFREEEIEDNNSVDPQVLDLMKHVDTNHVPRTTTHYKVDRPVLEEAAQGSKLMLKNDRCVLKAQDNNSQTDGFDIKDAGLVEGMDFDFEQDLLDAYSELIAENNPDDFLDLEGVFPGEVGLTERRDYPDPSGGVPVEELEEGEIAEY